MRLSNVNLNNQQVGIWANGEGKDRNRPLWSSRHEAQP
jgi:hypothetical protein